MTMHRLIRAVVDSGVVSPSRDMNHTEILQSIRGKYVDHRDGNALHNWLDNLRISTNAQNAWAFQRKRAGTSRYRGVSFRDGRYRATLTFNNRQIYGGQFDTQEDAALAYNRLALQHFGEFAHLNEVSGLSTGQSDARSGRNE
jgi:HNH endonuclease